MPDQAPATDGQKMSKQEMIDKIIELVESIKVTRKKTAEIKKQVIEKMHELERLQKKRELKEVEKEMDEMLA
jgi:regulator of replication initiation timing